MNSEHIPVSEYDVIPGDRRQIAGLLSVAYISTSTQYGKCTAVFLQNFDYRKSEDKSYIVCKASLKVLERVPLIV